MMSAYPPFGGDRVSSPFLIPQNLTKLPRVDVYTDALETSRWPRYRAAAGAAAAPQFQDLQEVLEGVLAGSPRT